MLSKLSWADLSYTKNETRAKAKLCFAKLKCKLIQREAQLSDVMMSLSLSLIIAETREAKQSDATLGEGETVIVEAEGWCC